MAYCKKCGTVLKKYIEICPLCGAPTGMEKTDDYGFYAGKAQHNGSGENADFSDSSEYRSMNAQRSRPLWNREIRTKNKTAEQNCRQSYRMFTNPDRIKNTGNRNQTAEPLILTIFIFTPEPNNSRKQSENTPDRKKLSTAYCW